MAHPRMYSDDDPFLLRLRGLCFAFPQAIEKETFGRPTFRCGKIFAYYGQGQSGHPRPASIQVLPEADEREALLADPRFYLPSYIGPYGWVGLDLTLAEPDWQEIAELLDSSYRRIAPAACLVLLERDGSPADRRP
ncbi:MmcQ/YjbR family DNA-binding protein [Arthrobacter glacialis]|uniref:MmcQ/YjbR family DNA-binding protein n=1 Tax=Arthrobacter glacialis TaxID=1664 RepID=UPI000CD43914|nr:MmcQ/YjbR family DNA-binding protein [Arthrobacter glacialis]POH59839.1 phosphoribosylglycinamide formyltransferase [Arthrobacter glacialis]